MNNTERYIQLGRIVKPHGVRGEIKIIFFNSSSRTLKSGMTVRIEDDGRIKGDFRINKVRYIPTAAIALLDKICSVEDAEVLRGGIISVKRDLLPELTEEEYYLTDLIGFTVNDHQQKRIGLVEDVMNLPANDVLILNYQEKELMIPLVDEFILLIDFEEKIVTVNVIDGLLEL